MNIMIVDNDKNLLRSLEIILVGRGHRVWTFYNPVIACEFIKQGEIPDILLLDHIMPELNGNELLQKLNGYLPEKCIVILITGHTDLIDRGALKEKGFSAILEKPIDLEKLSWINGISINCEKSNTDNSKENG